MTLVSHGALWKTDLQRPLLSLELALVQGFPALPVTDKTMLWSPRAMLKDRRLSPRVVQSMMGNAWHVPTAGSLFMFFLSCVTHRSFPLRAPPRAQSEEPPEQSQGPDDEPCC
jgi:hypothetical protein